MVAQSPLPAETHRVVTLARELDRLARQVVALSPKETVRGGGQNLADRLLTARAEYECTYRKMVALQEELDWMVYHLFGLCEMTSVPHHLLEEGLHPEDRPLAWMPTRGMRHNRSAEERPRSPLKFQGFAAKRGIGIAALMN
jgi:hypothetical protein